MKSNKIEANTREKIRTKTQKQSKCSKKCLLNLEQKVEILTLYLKSDLRRLLRLNIGGIFMHIPLKRVQMPDITAVKRIPEARKRKIKKKIKEILRSLGRKRYAADGILAFSTTPLRLAGALAALLALTAAVAFISAIFTKELYVIGIALLFICSAMQKTDVLHIRTVFCARIPHTRKSRRAPCTSCASAATGK